MSEHSNKIILIDNYDSFVYNIYQYLCQLGVEVDVFRNDEVSLENIKNYDGIVISPGPGRPEDSGLSPKIVEKFAGVKPILGVCLGHQTIGYVFGVKIVNAKRIMHGKISKVQHDSLGIFRGVVNPVSSVRYHSLVLEEVPPDFVLSAKSIEDDEIMGIRNEKLKIEGVQFHPESVMTVDGLKMLKNFIDIYVKSA
ncbi:MAG: aminodeoxychorismate/anthranilate synthase component II [Candidatus Calescibacterium sp.]|nr:aminodeoxychorismate/anthranilate synthase component II [Candidatus Calescibacterium sp.]MCX7734719.1 aminodeoxychorismate/anthranilate synthase component II [bacterium]MDW8087299.1 aminodeoxychorismate/anthranilate synthase component II [Candidatus Calescibacterium sp.]